MKATEIARLAERIIERAKGRPRFVVAIAGPPGAGKSTLAEQLFATLRQGTARSRVIPMDGFHLDNAILVERGLLDRKGSPETFDAAGFVHLMRRLVAMENDVVIPKFDRDKDIAVAGADVVSTKDKILLVEGNYLLLKGEPWRELQEMWDETIFINPGLSLLENRLESRWLEHGLTIEDAKKRAQGNDIPNAQYVLENSVPAKIKITG